MKQLRVFLVVVLTVILGACGSEEHQDIKQWMDESSRDLRGRVPPLPELKAFPVVSYDASGFTDPFSDARLDPERKDDGGSKPDFDRPKEALEGFPDGSVELCRGGCQGAWQTAARIDSG